MNKKYYKIWIIVFSIIILSSVFASLITKFNPYEVELTKVLIRPNKIHIMGTDSMGRDVFSRVLYGGRVSLSVAILSVLISTTIGTLYGVISGYFGGKVDSVMMRILDTFFSHSYISNNACSSIHYKRWHNKHDYNNGTYRMASNCKNSKISSNEYKK